MIMFERIINEHIFIDFSVEPLYGSDQMYMDYPVRFASLTGGRGSMSTALHGYRECPVELGSTSPRRGVDPLDTAKYILAARSALEGNIFDE